MQPLKPGSQQQQFNITPDMLRSSVAIECASCGGTTFNQAVMLRKVNKLIAATPQDVLLPAIPIYRCYDCGDIAQDLLPTFLQNTNPSE